MSELAYKRTNVYEVADEKLMKEIFDYAEGYKQFIDEGKTEREACAYVVAAANAKGYKPFEFGMKLKAGDKVYYNNRGKNVYLIKVGKADVAKDGIRIIASHIDSPRIDLKQVPFYESDGIAFAKTHYYGGLRKYQWAAIPLALHGAVALTDGSVLNVKIGEEENDPVFYISDLLPHLAAKQNAKPLCRMKNFTAPLLKEKNGSILFPLRKKFRPKRGFLPLPIRKCIKNCFFPQNLPAEIFPVLTGEPPFIPSCSSVILMRQKMTRRRKFSGFPKCVL